MRLDGLGLFLALALIVAFGVIVDVALLATMFRHRAALVGGLVVAALLIVVVAGLAFNPSERAGFFKGAPGGAALVVSSLTAAVFLPFIIVAPLGQYMCRGGRGPGWVYVWMGLQLALLPGFFLLANTEDHFWKQEYGAGQALGREASLSTIRTSADQCHERIWGTGWSYPWRLETPGGYFARRSAWIAGLAKGLDASTPIAGREPLSEPDRAALRSLIERHFAGYAIPNVQAKLLFEALEPGNYSKHLAPRGLTEPGVVSEEVLPLLLVRFEQYGCPGGQMMDEDRAVLNKLVLAKVRDYDEARKRELKIEADRKEADREMSGAPAPYRLAWLAANALGKSSVAQDVKAPDWSDYPQRVEQLCRGPK